VAIREFSGAGTRRGLGTDAAMAAVILLLGAFLAVSGAQLAQRLQTSAARRQSVSFEDHIGVAANTTGLIVVVWWALSFLIAFASALLERRGSRRAAAATGKFSPAFMRRLALAAVGLQLAAAPLAHAAPGPARPDLPSPPAVAAAWVPTGGPLSSTVPVTTAATAPPDPTAGSRSLGLDPHWTPGPAPVDPRMLAARPLRAQEPASGTAEVTVRAGDSLWGICAAELGPLASDVDVALAWPRLYQANRDVIGGDPGLLLPGQVLRMPVGP
jgi:nucleoid-associated protein YgaU